MESSSDEVAVPIEGEQLQPYKVAEDGLCWWCGAAAESREHKSKRTDLARMHSGDDLIWGSGDLSVTIRSIKRSAVVRFTANLCMPCNNAKSQPFDYAYDKFSEYIWANRDVLWDRRSIDMRGVFGDTWEIDVVNLARYFAKHVACRMRNDGYQVPIVIREFLNGRQYLP